MSSLRQIEDFLSQKRMAMIGVSRDPRDFSRTLFRELAARGYDIVPVNPAVSLVDDRHCYDLIGEILPPVSAALLMTPPEVTEDIVRECVAAKVNKIWLYRAIGSGSVSQNAVSYCREHHVELVEGYCPMMFLPGTGLVHRIHRFFSKLSGHYPK